MNERELLKAAYSYITLPMSFEHRLDCVCSRCELLGKIRAALAQPEGVWVPREPTNDMILAGMKAFVDLLGTPMTRYENIYKAMLSAAPGEGR